MLRQESGNEDSRLSELSTKNALGFPGAAKGGLVLGILHRSRPLICLFGGFILRYTVSLLKPSDKLILFAGRLLPIVVC
jgi:hypothetical protein